MLPEQVLKLATPFVEAFDREHIIEVEFRNIWRKAAEKGVLGGRVPMSGTTLHVLGRDTVELLEMRTRFIWEQLKQAVAAADADWYDGLAADLVKQVEIWNTPVINRAKREIGQAARGETIAYNSVFDSPLANMIAKLNAEIALFAANHKVTMKKRKEAFMQNITYNLNGPNPRVNINSTDLSINISNSEKIFAELRKAIESGIKDTELRAELLTKATDAERAVGTGDFLKKYSELIAHGANHMTVFGPFVPALTQLLPQ